MFVGVVVIITIICTIIRKIGKNKKERIKKEDSHCKICGGEKDILQVRFGNKTIRKFRHKDNNSIVLDNKIIYYCNNCGIVCNTAEAFYIYKELNITDFTVEL